MWSNVISIDKSYDKEIDFILKRLQCAKDVSSSIEESRDRMWMYLASVCDKQEVVEGEMLSLLQDVLLCYIKLRFFISRLKINKMTYAKCALVSSLVHFDREFENTIVSKTISKTLDYNVDGLLNFRLRVLKDGWQEVSEVANRLLEASMGDDDIFDISSFICGSDGKKSRLHIVDNRLYNQTIRDDIKIFNVFDNDEYNLLFAVISQKPSEIVIEQGRLSKELVDTLKRIARVIER